MRRGESRGQAACAELAGEGGWLDRTDGAPPRRHAPQDDVFAVVVPWEGPNAPPLPAEDRPRNRESADGDAQFRNGTRTADENGRRCLFVAHPRSPQDAVFAACTDIIQKTEPMASSPFPVRPPLAGVNASTGSALSARLFREGQVNAWDLQRGLGPKRGLCRASPRPRVSIS